MAQPADAEPRPWASVHVGVWTEEELARLPRDGNRYETVDGSLVVTPPADVEHHGIADRICFALASAAPPHWFPVREVGVSLLGDSRVIPDVTVLRPGAPLETEWNRAEDVALVVEVESPSSRRHDRFTKPGLYAEAGVESYWRIECTANGPVAHAYTRAGAGHYQLHRSVNPGESHVVELPFAVQLAPATWLATGER